MYDEFTRGDVPIEVETTTLDEYFKDVNRKINFIKIDIDGSETRAIKGAKKLMGLKDIKMIVEFVPSRIRDSGLEPQEFLDLIKEQGFKKIMAVDEQNRKLYPAEVNKLLKKCEDLKKLGEKGQGEFINLICEK